MAVGVRKIWRQVEKTRPPFLLGQLSLLCTSMAQFFCLSEDLRANQAGEVGANGALPASVLKIRANKPWLPWNLGVQTDGRVTGWSG